MRCINILIRVLCPNLHTLPKVRTPCQKFGHPAQSLDTIPKVRTLCPKFGHPAQSLDTLPKIWTPFPKFGPPVHSSDIYLSSSNRYFCTGKIILKILSMTCQFCNCFSFRMVIFLFFVECLHLHRAATDSVLRA